MKCMQAAHCKYCIVRDSMYPINMSLAEILSQFSTQTTEGIISNAKTCNKMNVQSQVTVSCKPAAPLTL